MNADLIVAPSAAAEERIQRIRVDEIVRRASGRDSRFPDAAAVRAFLDALEAGGADQPLTVEQDLRILRETGFPEAAVFWLEYREAVTGGSLGKHAATPL